MSHARGTWVEPSYRRSSLFSTIQRISLYLFSKSGHECVLKVEVIFEDPISTSVGCQILAKDVNFQMKVGGFRLYFQKLTFLSFLPLRYIKKVFWGINFKQKYLHSVKCGSKVWSCYQYQACLYNKPLYGFLGTEIRKGLLFV